MATILCIETATTNCSVALSVNGSVTAFKEDNTPGYSHAEKLHVFIAEILEETNLSTKDLDAVAVSKGPGSYTGLRIGVSAAKGLCYSLDIPLIAIPTLEVLAHQITETDGFIIPMLDARRMEVYAAVYNSNKAELRETKAEILTEDSFGQYISKNKSFFIGSGVEKFMPLIKSSNAKFVKDTLPSAKQMASIAEEKHKKNDTEDVAYFDPYYLKDFKVG